MGAHGDKHHRKEEWKEKNRKEYERRITQDERVNREEREEGTGSATMKDNR